jgi:hypothetical protein
VPKDKFQGSPSFDISAVNDAGQLLFISEVTTTGSNYCLFRGKPLSRLLNSGQPAPNNNGMAYLPGGVLHEWPAFNQKGVMAFVASLTGTAGGSTDDSAIYRTGAPHQLTQIVREGQNVPEGNGVFNQMLISDTNHPVLNESGQVAFRAALRNTSGGFSDNQGVYRGNGTTLIKIARAGQALPGSGTLVIFSTSSPDMNDSGEVVFPISLVGGSGQQQSTKAPVAP